MFISFHEQGLIKTRQVENDKKERNEYSQHTPEKADDNVQNEEVVTGGIVESPATKTKNESLKYVHF